MHCFPGDKEVTKKILDLGLYISFAGNVTFKNATILQESAQYVPLNRLLLETDAPFLTPVPKRGKKNIPEYILHTYDFIANIRNCNIEVIKDAIYANFNSLRE